MEAWLVLGVLEGREQLPQPGCLGVFLGALRKRRGSAARGVGYGPWVGQHESDQVRVRTPVMERPACQPHSRLVQTSGQPQEEALCDTVLQMKEGRLRQLENLSWGGGSVLPPATLGQGPSRELSPQPGVLL